MPVDSGTRRDANPTNPRLLKYIVFRIQLLRDSFFLRQQFVVKGQLSFDSLLACSRPRNSHCGCHFVLNLYLLNEKKSSYRQS